MAKDNLVLLGRAVLSTFIFFILSFRVFEIIKKITSRRRFRKEEEKKKRALKERLKVHKKRIEDDIRSVSGLVFYDGRMDYEEAVIHRSAVNLKQYLGTVVDLNEMALSKKELSFLEKEIAYLMDLSDDLHFGSFVYVYLPTIRRIYGELVLRQIK